MAVWVHLVLLPLLYLADGKPPPPGGAAKKNLTDVEEDASNNTDSQIYHFDYNLFKNKSQIKAPSSRFARKIIRDNFVLDRIEVKFDWNKIQIDRRLGTFFLLKDENEYLENAILYPPNDETLTVRGLKEGKSYFGEVRLIRDKEGLEDLNKTREEDRFPFIFDSPRIISERDLNTVLDNVNSLPPSRVKLEKVAINFKLPSLQEHTVLELVDVYEKNDTSRVVVHMAPKTISLVVNDIPGRAILRMVLRSGENVTHQALIFTGALQSPSTQPLTKSSLLNDEGRERLTVKCFVKDKPPFQGFPCRGSDICIPLHWECDGEEDCSGGYDESRCEVKPTKPPVPKCKKNEFGCKSRGVRVCLPTSWLCDGRTDCTDGWDERKENCRRSPDGNNATTYTFCDRSHFKCYRGGCVVNHRVCDGYKDCSDGSDEYDCPDDEEEDDNDDDDDDDDDDDVFCDSRFEFTCDRMSAKRKCIPKPWVCDDQNDCPFGEDEEDRACRSHFHNYFDKSVKRNEETQKSATKKPSDSL